MSATGFVASIGPPTLMGLAACAGLPEPIQSHIPPIMTVAAGNPLRRLSASVRFPPPPPAGRPGGRRTSRGGDHGRPAGDVAAGCFLWDGPAGSMPRPRHGAPGSPDRSSAARAAASPEGSRACPAHRPPDNGAPRSRLQAKGSRPGRPDRFPVAPSGELVQHAFRSARSPRERGAEGRDGVGTGSPLKNSIGSSSACCEAKVRFSAVPGHDPKHRRKPPHPAIRGLPSARAPRPYATSADGRYRAARPAAA